MGVCDSKSDKKENYLSLNAKYGSNINEKPKKKTPKYDCRKIILNYYLFHKKIEDILSKGQSQINDYNKSNQIFGASYDARKFYLLNISLVDKWKKYVDYDIIKGTLDKLFNESNLEGNIPLQDKPFIYDYTYNNSTATYNKFISNKLFTIKDFDYLVDKKTYKEFKDEIMKNNYSSYDNFNSYESTENHIDGFISDRMIVLFFDKDYIIRIFYRGIIEDKSEIIQLTINCKEKGKITYEFDKDKSKSKYKHIKDYILRLSDQDLIALIENNQANILHKTDIKIENYSVTIINDFQNNKYNNKNTQTKPIDDIEKINFNNVNQMRLIGLDNVGATCYMNATLECLINIDPVTRYLLTEKIYNQIVNDNSTFCLSGAYCRLLEKVCLDDTITKHYAPEEFKRVISAKNPLFEGINANDSKDLINFLLEEFNNELTNINIPKEINNQVSNGDGMLIDSKNLLLTLKFFIEEYTKKMDSIISRNFFFIAQSSTVCRGCKELRHNFQTMFMLEFPLQLVYNFNVNRNIPSINNRGNKCVNL